MVGAIWSKFYATCGRCGGIESLTTAGPHAANLKAKEKGWQHLGDEGWVCPVCIEETPSAPATEEG